MERKKNIAIAIVVLLLAGCYTQFRTMEQRYPAYPRQTAVAGSDTALIAEDSVPGADTVVVKEREVCNWERNFFGDWELRCHESNYSSSWHRYQHRPWWYRSYNYNAYDCSCPYHVFYHPNCQYCWQYCDQNSYYGYGGYGYGYGHYGHGYGKHIYIHHIHDTISGKPSGSKSVKATSPGTGRKDGNQQNKPVIGPAPGATVTPQPGIPAQTQTQGTSTGKKPDTNINTTGNTSGSSKPAKVNTEQPRKRTGRGR